MLLIIARPRYVRKVILLVTVFCMILGYWPAPSYAENGGTDGMLMAETSVTNLVYNPGFEIGSASPSGWDSSVVNTNGVLELDEDIARSGNRSVKLTVPTIADRVSVSQWKIPVEAGKKYAFSVYYKTENMTGKPMIQLNWFQASTYLSEERGYGDQIADDWKLLVMSVEAPENATFLTIVMHNLRTPGTVWFDDVSLVAKDAYAMISPASAQFDKYAPNQQDLPITMTVYNTELASISNGTTPLTEGLDYTVSGSIVTFKKQYLSSLPLGSQTIEFAYDSGDTNVLEVTVVDTAPADGNILKNPSFETGAGSPDSWQKTADGTWEWDATGGYNNSSRSVKLIPQPDKPLAAFQQYVPVIGGKHYEVNSYYKTENANGRAFMKIDWYSSMTPLVWISATPLAEANVSAEGWQNIKLNASAPPNATHALVSLHYRNGIGAVWYDEASMKRIVLDSGISPANTFFDKKETLQQDIVIAIEANGNALEAIYLEEDVLQPGGDYEVTSEGGIRLKKQFLAALPVGNNRLTFRFSDGADQILELAVIDSTGMSESYVYYDKNTTDPQGKTIAVSNDKQLTVVRNGDDVLTEGNQYSFQEHTVTFSKAYLISLQTGEHILTMEFEDQTKATVIIHIVEFINQKNRSTIYTTEKVNNARENAENFDWVADLRAEAVAKAEQYLSNGYEFLWEAIPPQSLPRSYAVNESMGSPVSGKEINQFGNYPYMGDPMNKPWKIIDPSAKDQDGNYMMYPTNDFGAYYRSGLDEHGIFRPELADRSLLVNELYPEKGETWGVDDGFGWVDENGNRYTFIAYYVHWMLWYYKHSLIQNALHAFRDAYVYTGDPEYARAGMILLDRIADLYPSYDTSVYRPNFLHNGVDGKGKAVGSIWETFIIKDFISAYDAFFPAADDPELIAFLSEKAKRIGLANPKLSGAAIRSNIEEGIIRQVYPAVKNADIRGNIGMHQSALAMAAVVYDTLPDTKEWLDFAFRQGGLEFNPQRVTGGNILPTLVNLVDRDGNGDEASPSYNRLWLDNFRMTADLLNGYDLYEAADLYQNVKMKRLFTGIYPLFLIERYTPSIGDSGLTGMDDIWLNIAHMVKAFEIYRDPIFAQAAYFLNGNSVSGIKGDPFSANPEQIAGDIAAIIETYGPLDMKSGNMSGYGFAALRDGSNELSPDGSDSLRDLWMYYGRSTGHGHSDTLNLGYHAYGLDLMPDLGYPELATSLDWNRFEWVRHTISHNTVLVDQTRPELQWVADPKHFDDSGQVKMMDVEASKVYPQTDLYKRTTAMIRVDDEHSYAVDFFRVKGGNEHLFSFHGAEGDVTTEGLTLTAQTDENGNYVGSYAGPNIKFGERPAGDSVAGSGYRGPGFHYLKNVDRDQAPDSQFSVEWNVKDTWNVYGQGAGAETDVRLRLTMLGQLDDVALADGIPPQNKPGNPANLKYVLAHRTGTNLNSLFASVIEPYNGSRYIRSISPVSVEANGQIIADDIEVKAVKILLENGRTDYVVSSLNPDAIYTIDGKFQFQGFLGVYSEKDGEPVYGYVNDGTFIGAEDNALVQAETGRVEGTVTDFTKTLSMQNELTVQMDLQGMDRNLLVGESIYVQNDGERNAVYEIKGIVEVESGLYKLDLGDTTLIRRYANDSDLDQGFVYDIASGDAFYIPLTHITQVLPVLKQVDLTPSSLVLQSGDTSALAISGLMSDGSAADLSQAQIAYSSNNAQVAVSDGSGVVKAIGEGSATIKATVTLRGVSMEGSSTVIVDKSPPITSLSTDRASRNGWFNSDVLLTLSATDNLSGIGRTEYRVDGEGDWIEYTTPIALTGEGTIDLQYRSIDRAGNMEEIKQQSVRIDRTFPSFLLSANGSPLGNGGSFDVSVPLTFQAADTLSGLEAASLAVSGATYWIDPQASSSIDIDFAGNPGSYTATINAEDLAGNKHQTEFAFTVTTSIHSIKILLTRYMQSGDSVGPLFNNLDQAKRQLDKGRKDQAAKHLQDFVKHLDTPAFSKALSEEGKQILNANADALIRMWWGQ